MNSQNHEDDRMYTVREAASYLAVSISLVYREVEQGEIGHVRVGNGGGTIRFTKIHLDEYKHSRES